MDPEGEPGNLFLELQLSLSATQVIRKAQSPAFLWTIFVAVLGEMCSRFSGFLTSELVYY